MSAALERLASNGPQVSTQPLLLIGAVEETQAAGAALLRAWTDPPEKPVDLTARQLVWDRDAGTADDAGRWPISALLRTLSLQALASRGVGISLIGASADTQTALLKTLEEPPQRTRLLVCASPHTPVLATLRSRCAVHTLTAPTAAELVAWAAGEGIEIDLATAQLCPDRAAVRLLAAQPQLIDLLTGADARLIARALHAVDKSERSSLLRALLGPLARVQPGMAGRCADALALLDRGVRAEAALGLLLL